MATKEIEDKNLFFRLNIDIWIKKLDPLFENEIKRFENGYKIYALELERAINYKGFVLFGKIDRIDYNGKNFQIIDYKSSKIENKIVKDLKKVSDFQLVFYYLLSKNLGDIEGVYYYDLYSAQLKKENQLNEKVEYLTNILDSLNEKIINFDKCDNINNCLFCPYKIICNRF